MNRPSLPPRTVALFGSIVLVLAAAVAGALGPALASGADDVTSPASSAPVPSAAPSGTSSATRTAAAEVARSDPTATEVPLEADITTDDASDLITDALEAVETIANDPDTEADDFTDLVTGAYQEEIAAQSQELVDQGWTLSGEPVITSIKGTSAESTSDGDTATLAVCIDASDVQLYDADGAAIGDPSATPPSLHLFTLVREDQVWLVTAHSFPDDPTC